MSEPVERLRAALADRYTIQRELGQGGMATVYLAHDIKHDRQVAVKVLRPELAAVVGAKRFLNEIKLTANLQHPHILPLHDSGEADTFLYYVMPFVEGETLRDKLDREKQLSITEALHIARAVASALDYAHRHDVIHRDIKPENILLHDGEAVVADFGIALAVGEVNDTRLTDTGLSLGSPRYMSPEQAAASPDIGPRSDIYALACVVYEMLAGEPPHTGPTARAIIAKIMSDQPQSLSVVRDTVPAHVAAAVRKALAKVPPDRHETTAQFIEELTTPPGTHVVDIVRRARRPVLVGLGIAVTGVVAGFATDWTFNPWRDEAVGAGATSHRSIAVLPFANLGGNEEDDYLAAGLAEELIDALTRVEGLRVAPRTSSFALAGQVTDLRELGRRLRVATVVEGSIRATANSLTVRARLTDVEQGFLLWSQTFDRDPDDVFAVQEEISQAIVAALDLRTPSSAGARPLTRQIDDVEAHRLFVRGRYHWSRRTEADLKTAVRHFEDVIERVPDFAQAHAHLGDAYAVIGFYDYMPPGVAFQRARAAAKTALELDASLGQPHATLGYIAVYYDWNWSDSEREFQLATTLSPEYAVGYQWYANYLTSMGRFDEARAAIARAQELDPLSLIISAVSGWISYYSGDFERSVAEFNETFRLDPNFAIAHLFAGKAYEELGLLDVAVQSIRRSVALSGESDIMIAGLAHAYALVGRRDTVMTMLTELEAASETRYVPAFEIATVYAALGETAEALEWLNQAYDRRSHSMVFLRVDPQMAPLRSEPEFQRLLKAVGLE